MAKNSGLKLWTGKKSKSEEQLLSWEEVIALRKELQTARQHVQALRERAELDGKKIAEIETQCAQLQNEKGQWEEGIVQAGDTALLNSSLRAKVDELEMVVKPLKATVVQLENELLESRSCKEELGDVKHHLQEALAEVEQLRAERDRSITRSRLQGLTGERGVREELAKLQKDFIKLEFTAKKEKEELEAQLDLVRDGLTRVQEKANKAQTHLKMKRSNCRSKTGAWRRYS